MSPIHYALFAEGERNHPACLEALRRNTVNVLSSETLREVLCSKWPTTATCWSQATDEIRDMCRTARHIVQLDQSHAVAFREIREPSEWNRQGIDKTVEFYTMMTAAQQREFKHWLR